MKTINTDRESRECGRIASKDVFVEATLRYKPATIRVLFIAEAPPAFRFNRLFYFEELRDGDTLFLEMMKTLYGCAVGFTGNGFSSVSSAAEIRNRKSELLARFMREGYFLIDASEEPMPDQASSSRKLARLRASLPRLMVRLEKFGVGKNTPIVLIGGVTYAACAQPLWNLGFNLINTEMIDHPARGGQLRFREKLRHTLQRISPDQILAGMGQIPASRTIRTAPPTGEHFPSVSRSLEALPVIRSDFAEASWPITEDAPSGIDAASTQQARTPGSSPVR
ncbi:MAG: hypothetical protein WBW84_14395 [Acidobacteriaceae bacterium]